MSIRKRPSCAVNGSLCKRPSACSAGSTAALNMNIESWRITKRGQCLDSLLDIMLVRRATDNVDGGSYDATWLQPFLSRQPSFHFEFPTLSAVQRFKSRRHLSVGMICKCVQINYEVTDHCTRQICQAMGRVPGKHGSRKYQERKLMWARVMSRCSGRAFLQLAADEGLHGASIPTVLGDAWDRLSAQTKSLMDPGDFFSPHFNRRIVITIRYDSSRRSAGFTSLEFLRIRGGCFEPVEGPHG